MKKMGNKKNARWGLFDVALALGWLVSTSLFVKNDKEMVSDCGLTLTIIFYGASILLAASMLWITKHHND